MSSKNTVALPVPRATLRAGDRGLRWVGATVALLGALLLLLAAGDALAGVDLGGGGDDSLRGSAAADRLAGFGGGDVLHGAAGDDTVHGGAGDDTVYGGAGEDDVLGGTGDDFIEARDGKVDRVSCGPGRDTVSLDRKDLVSPDCETVYAG